MSKIRIVRIPRSFASIGISKQWLGAEMPFQKKNIDGDFEVLSQDAIAALRLLGREEAASYWEKAILQEKVTFAEEFCDIID
ncbi:hypothetical protein KC842_00795 [Candidatus Nomurabacteria bacterium]|nr:hypothetical protein [Candidatus Nomurabacteria bacterium]USN95020.1 MAG: hypothetical protein H6791_01145 [Candidatus Nomurabacteria bacterium]